MRTAIILATCHGEDVAKMVSGPEVVIVKQLERFKDLKRLEVHKAWKSAELWISDEGLAATRQFLSPAEFDKKVNAKKDAAEAAAKAIEAKANEPKKVNANEGSKNIVLKNEPAKTATQSQSQPKQ